MPEVNLTVEQADSRRPETHVASGNVPDRAVKVLKETDDVIVVGGYGVVFGGYDLEGEQFLATTDYDLDLVPVKRTLYDHGQHELFGKTVFGRVGEGKITPDEIGLWVEAELDKHNEYMGVVSELLKAGVLGYSTGTAAHLTERIGKTITRWPIIEVSLTTTPAEVRTLGVRRIKELADAIPELKALVPQEVAEESHDEDDETGEGLDEAAVVNITIVQGESEMPELQEDVQEGQPQAEGVDTATKRFDALEKAMGTLSERMNVIVEQLERQASLKDLGYVAPDSETDHGDVKSFGDFLVAIYRGNHRRLKTVYKSRKVYDREDEMKDVRLEPGASGGYLVPSEYRETLLQLAADQSQLTQLVTQVPVARDTGKWPSLDQFITPTAGSGQTALAAGVTAATVAAGGALTETQPGFEQVQWNVTKQGGYVEVENELVADSVVAVEALLQNLFAVAIAAKNERNILRGSGAGEPLGILNAAATIGVTTASDNTFAWVDALNMRSRFKRILGSPVWVIHPGVWPDIGQFEVGTGGAVWQGNLAGAGPATLLNYPILESEHMPQDDNDDVLLIDPRAYLFFMRQELAIAFSEHAAFTSDKGTWRFLQRNDGQPWVSAAITLADPQGSYTVSPFVYHDD